MRDKPGTYRTYNYIEKLTADGQILGNEAYQLQFYNTGSGGSIPTLTFGNGGSISINGTALVGSSTPFKLIADPQYPIVDTIEVTFSGGGVNELTIIRSFALPIDPDSAKATKTF